MSFLSSREKSSPGAAIAGGSPGKRRALVICTHLRPGRNKRRSRYMMQPISGLHVASLIDQRLSTSRCTTRIGMGHSTREVAQVTI